MLSPPSGRMEPMAGIVRSPRLGSSHERRRNHYCVLARVSERPRQALDRVSQRPLQSQQTACWRRGAPVATSVSEHAVSQWSTGARGTLAPRRYCPPDPSIGQCYEMRMATPGGCATPVLHLSHKLDVWILGIQPLTSSHMPNGGRQKTGRYRPSPTGLPPHVSRSNSLKPDGVLKGNGRRLGLVDPRRDWRRRSRGRADHRIVAPRGSSSPRRSHPRELSHRGAALPPEMRREFRPSLLSYTSFKA
jgi:hypothetical protein